MELIGEPDKVVKLTISISDEADKKLRELAKYRCRSLSQQIEYLILVAKFVDSDQNRPKKP